MKRLSLITASTLLACGTISGAQFTFEFFNPFSPIIHTGTDNMIWGIVITTSATPSNAFEALEGLNPNQFEHGLGVSGQWLTEDLYYLTGGNAGGENNGLLPRTSLRSGIQGSRTGSFGTLSDIEIPIGPNGEHDFGNASLALIWFDLKDEIPENGRISAVPGQDQYGFLHIEGFRLTQTNGSVPVFNSYIPAHGATLPTTETFVPEPSTYALLIAGVALAGTAVCRRRVKAKAA